MLHAPILERGGWSLKDVPAVGEDGTAGLGLRTRALVLPEPGFCCYKTTDGGSASSDFEVPPLLQVLRKHADAGKLICA